MKYISEIRSGIYRKYFNAMLAILLLAASAGSEAATVLLRRPIPLLPEAAARLNQVHADRDLRMWQLVVFGFAHCKDVCPASLANLSMLVKAGVAERIRLGGIFVTIDPDRDTDATLSQYIKVFGTNLAICGSRVGNWSGSRLLSVWKPPSIRKMLETCRIIRWIIALLHF